MKVMPLRLTPGDDLRQRAAEATTIQGELEILSLSGTLSADGGHLCAGSLVRTTAELVIGLRAEWRQKPLYLQEHQLGHASTDAAALVIAQQLHYRKRAGTDLQAPQ